MTPSNFHKKGFMLVEVMFAVALLGIFGSTLFISQNSLYAKIFKSHFAEKIAILVDGQMLEYTMKIKEAELANSSILIPSISKKFDNPQVEITVSGEYFELPVVKNNDSGSEKKKPSLFKVHAKIVHEFGEENIYLLLHKPQPEEAS